MADREKKDGLLKQAGKALAERAKTLTAPFRYVGRLAKSGGKMLKGKWEALKNQPFKWEIGGMVKMAKEKLIQLAEKLIKALQKESKETGVKALKGELDITPNRKTVEGPVSELTGNSKTMQKTAEKTTEKAFGMNNRTDVSQALEAANIKATKDLGVTGPAMETPNLGQSR